MILFILGALCALLARRAAMSAVRIATGALVVLVLLGLVLR